MFKKEFYVFKYFHGFNLSHQKQIVNIKNITKSIQNRKKIVDSQFCLLYALITSEKGASGNEIYLLIFHFLPFTKTNSKQLETKDVNQMATETKRQRIRVCLKAYDHKLIDVSADKIVETAKRTDAKVAGPIPLPTKRRIYCVLRSPHVDKKSREHFEMRTHKRIIDIYDPTQQTTEELSRLDLPAGVDIEVKL